MITVVVKVNFVVALDKGFSNRTMSEDIFGFHNGGGWRATGI